MTPKELRKLQKARQTIDQRKEKKEELQEVEYKTLLVEEKKQKVEKKVEKAKDELMFYRSRITHYTQVGEKIIEYIQKSDDLLAEMSDDINAMEDNQFQAKLLVQKQYLEAIGKLVALTRAGFFSPASEDQSGFELIIRTQGENEDG